MVSAIDEIEKSGSNQSLTAMKVNAPRIPEQISSDPIKVRETSKPKVRPVTARSISFLVKYPNTDESAIEIPGRSDQRIGNSK